MGEIYGRREILLNLVRKELKVKYTASVLGAVWSILNPIVFLAVFTFVSLVLGNETPHYPVYLLSGLLAYNFFSTSITQAAQSVLGNSNLVKKVAFPKEILPLSAVGVALVDFVLQMAVLLLFILVSGYGFHVEAVVLFPLSVITLLVFTTAISLLVSALNVRYRDIQHLLNLGLLVWFWMTPIVYPGALVQQHLEEHVIAGVNLFYVYFLNPLAGIVGGFQRALYAVVSPVTFDKATGTFKTVPVLYEVSVSWLTGVLGITLLGSLVLLWLCWRTFFRLSGDFAEEL